MISLVILFFFLFLPSIPEISISPKPQKLIFCFPLKMNKQDFRKYTRLRDIKDCLKMKKLVWSYYCAQKNATFSYVLHFRALITLYEPNRFPTLKRNRFHPLLTDYQISLGSSSDNHALHLLFIYFFPKKKQKTG